MGHLTSGVVALWPPGSGRGLAQTKRIGRSQLETAHMGAKKKKAGVWAMAQIGSLASDLTA